MTRSELLSVAVPSANPFIYAFVTEDAQTVVVTESFYIRLDWLKWVTEKLGGSAINATYTLHRTQVDEYGIPIGPLELVNLSSQNRITVQLNVAANEYYIQVPFCVKTHDFIIIGFLCWRECACMYLIKG